MSVTNAIEAGTCRQGDSGWASAGRPGGGGGGAPPTPSNASLPAASLSFKDNGSPAIGAKRLGHWPTSGCHSPR